VSADELTVPSLGVMGYPEPSKPSPHPGGETVALARMREHLAKKPWIASFEKVRVDEDS